MQVVCNVVQSSSASLWFVIEHRVRKSQCFIGIIILCQLYLLALKSFLIKICFFFFGFFRIEFRLWLPKELVGATVTKSTGGKPS